MLPHSLRWRVQLWHSCLLAIIVIALFTTYYRNQSEIIHQQLDRDLSHHLTSITPLLNRRPALAGPSQRAKGARRERLQEALSEMVDILAQQNIYTISLDGRDRIKFASPGAPQIAPITREPRSRGVQFRTTGHLREAYEMGQRGRIFICGGSLTPIDAKLTQLLWKLTALGTVIIIGGIVVGAFLTGRSLQPITRIGTVAKDIANGNLSSRVEQEDDKSELGQLSHILNETFTTLEQSFRRQTRFTADASHEMRTPLSVILAKSQFALRKERSPEHYREALEICANSADHMRKLIDSLLDLSQADAGQLNLQKEAVDLSALITAAIALITPLADQRNITTSASLAPVTGSLDGPRMSQVILNLLGNAVKYNDDDGTIDVNLEQKDGVIALTVTNSGPGIAAASLPLVFDRFYRGDSARTVGKESSTGLGLPITQAIVEAHGGRIFAESSRNSSTAFTVEIPLTNTP